jgi:hypothetical protein
LDPDQINALGRDLGGKAESIRRTGTRDPHLRATLSGDGPRNMIGGGRKADRALDAPCKGRALVGAASMARQDLVDGRDRLCRGSRCEDAAAPLAWARFMIVSGIDADCSDAQQQVKPFDSNKRRRHV